MPEVIESTSTVDSTPVESSAVDTVESTPVESVDSPVEGSEPETQEGEQPQEQQGDGRRMPEEFKQYLKELRATNPNLARRLANEYHLAQQIRASYPGGMKDIQRVAQIAESIGGEEGIAAIEAERAEWNALDQQFTAGDPQFVENISQQDPEAFKKIVPHALIQYSKLDPDGYAHLLAPILRDTIEPTVRRMYDALSQDEKYRPLAAELAKWYNGIDEVARNKPVPKVDPEREKLQKERTDWENQKAQEFNQSVLTANQTFRVEALTNELNAQLTKMGRNAATFKAQQGDSYKILLRNCEEAALNVLRQDQKWITGYNAVLQTGDKNKANQMHNAKIQQIIKGDASGKGAVSKTLRAFMAFGNPVATNGQPRPAQSIVPANGKPKAFEVQLSKIPNDKDIDKSRMGSDYVKMIMDGKVYLRGRKELFRF